MLAKSKVLQRFTAEFFVIVVGILAALAVDDYRDYRSDRETEVFLLAQLNEDLGQDLAELSSIVEDAEERFIAAQAIRRAIGDASPAPRGEISPTVDSLAALMSPGLAVRILTSTLDFDITRRTFEHMSQTGGFQKLQNRELGQAISAYYRFVAAQNLTAANEVEQRSRLVALLERSGLTRSDDVSDDTYVAAIREDVELAAVIRNSQDLALSLRLQFSRFRARALELKNRIELELANG